MDCVIKADFGGRSRSNTCRILRKLMKEIEVFTDGACSGNPGVGGWGAILRYNDHEKELYGGEELTTNNRMEMMAAIKALIEIKGPCKIILTTDSKYLRDGISKWIHNWRKNGWKTSKREPVKNADLWRQLDTLVEQHDVEWHWVKGHSGHKENEQADALARLGIEELRSKSR